jgi:hypothetical protein
MDSAPVEFEGGKVLRGSERRATDRVVKIWQNATDKQTIVAGIDRSLWDHCFLLVMDEMMDCSIIIDHGNKAGEGLQLVNGTVQSLRKLPRCFADEIFSLGKKCMKTRKPYKHAQDRNRSRENPVSRYRLALLPLVPAEERDDYSNYPVTSVLGVFTYQ